jgi:aerobic C4-dicarboxylate transport protein
VQVLDRTNHVVTAIMGIVMRLAPLGAFGAMAFTIGKFGLSSLISLGQLMGATYLTMAVFVFGVLGLIARAYGFSIWRLLVHIREEILLVVGTSSSESALPRLMTRLEEFGCDRKTVGLVVPAGYTLNLDGTTIYLSMAVMFLAQAFHVDLGLGQIISLMLVLMVASKGAAAISGGGFIVLAATLASTGVLPVAGLALLLGVDKFMAEARSVTNLIGNAVAAVVISKSEGAFQEPTTREQ